jgi:hypothetical protein
MLTLRLAPVILCYLLLAAHFFRGGNLLAVAVCLFLPLALTVPRRWAARLVQAGLLLGAVEWIRTLVAIASRRETLGEPWVRMAVILGAVAAATLVSILVFRGRAVREHYRA